MQKGAQRPHDVIARRRRENVTRLVVFLGFLTTLVLVLNFRSYQSLPPTRDRFDYEQAAQALAAHREEMVELERKRMELLFPPEVEEIIEEEGPLVVLDTPELERGHALYSKCIVCHGRDGRGKRSQNAPAIGGQYDWYVEKQVIDMQAGLRENQTMMPYIKRLSPEDIEDLATYISRLPWIEN